MPETKPPNPQPKPSPASSLGTPNYAHIQRTYLDQFEDTLWRMDGVLCRAGYTGPDRAAAVQEAKSLALTAVRFGRAKAIEWPRRIARGPAQMRDLDLMVVVATCETANAWVAQQFPTREVYRAVRALMADLMMRSLSYGATQTVGLGRGARPTPTLLNRLRTTVGADTQRALGDPAWYQKAAQTPPPQDPEDP